MIKYNLNTINDWNFGDDNINKVYYDNAVCYYKVVSSGGTTAQTPCFAVVDNISQYQETEFEDVFNKADNSWYKLNNLSQYEKYGLYGSGLTITTYEGKLTVDGSDEYIYSGGSWVYVGEVSGGTAQLPNVPFTVNYNAKNYNSSTKTIAKTSGQLADVDAVISGGTPTVYNNYITIATNTRALITGYQQYFNRDNNNPNLTIISKQRTSGSNCHLLANRANTYNWMYRAYNNKLTLHGTSEQGSVAVTQQPVIESVRVDGNGTATYNNYTDNTSSNYNGFTYGGANSIGAALFAGYYNSGGEWFKGDFYWIYMSQSTLTDEQVQQVIDYNEGNGGGETIYPLEYTVKSGPPNDLVFSSMEEALAYECPWDGMTATIGGVRYVFDSEEGWVEPPAAKWVATYTGGAITSAECDSTSEITRNEITKANLESVVIGDCVSALVGECFSDCSKLSAATINGYTSIDHYCFARNNGTLKTITMLSPTPPPCATTAFTYYNNGYVPMTSITIYVPAASVNAYKAASGWSRYADKIQAIP